MDVASDKSRIPTTGALVSKNLAAGACSILIPGSGHLILGRTGAGAVWLALAIALYVSVALFRLATNLMYLGIAELVWFALSCAAATDCSLRGSQFAWSRRAVIFMSIVVVAVFWTFYANVWIAAVVGVRDFVVPTRAMAPTIQAGDHLVVDTHYYRYHHPKDGEIVVVFRDGIHIVKRVMAIGGDTIEMTHGRIIRNGAALQESYARYMNTPPPQDWLRNLEPRLVPPSKLFVMGDNRDDSYDSRSPDVGYYDESDVRGKVIEIVRWPW